MSTYQYRIYKSDLPESELQELGVAGPWFLERNDGDVKEFRTEEEVRDLAISLGLTIVTQFSDEHHDGNFATTTDPDRLNLELRDGYEFSEKFVDLEMNRMIGNLETSLEAQGLGGSPGTETSKRVHALAQRILLRMLTGFWNGEQLY